jgi:ribosomal protein S11
MGLRLQLIGTLVGAILIFFAISAIAANTTMSSDLSDLAKREVTSGALGFSGYWDSKKDQVRLLTTQIAIQDAIRKDVQTKDGKALGDALSNIARGAELSFLTVTDTSGNVIARANGGATGVKTGSPFVDRALTGETVSTAAKLGDAELQAEQLGPQVDTDVKGPNGTSSHIAEGIAIVSAAPISDQNERTIGAIYAGVVMNHAYDVVDQATRSLGGKAAILLGPAIVASSISNPDGTRFIDSDIALPPTALTGPKPYQGNDTEAGTDYLTEVDPILDDQNTVIGARWYGIPLSTFRAIQAHTIQSIVLWGFVGLIVALALAIPVVERLSRMLITRSRQVRASAKELAIAIVGSEVSGDHVAMTKAAVEKQGEILGAVMSAPLNGATEKVAEAAALNAEIYGDVIVIDTLATEMSGRMQQAVSRVNELNDVAEGLNELVTGSKN